MARQIKVRCLKDFRDGNILPRQISAGEVLTVTNNQWLRLSASGPDYWERLGEVIPPPTKSKPEESVKASPHARLAAEALGVDLSGVEGTGKSGYITKSDVETAADG